MVDQALDLRRQIALYLEADPVVPQFSASDWLRLSQIVVVLRKFDEFTKLVSEKRPQIGLSLAVYYELSDLLQEIRDREGEFEDFDSDFAKAADTAIGKFKKYYTFMDLSNTYYTAALLDPRVKTELLKKELSCADSRFLIETIRNYLWEFYQPEAKVRQSMEPGKTSKSVESRMLQKISREVEESTMSDLDQYLTSPVVSVPQDLVDQNDDWLLRWWNARKEEYPIMARIARDFLAIPGSEVSVERLFSGGRDLLGLRRHRLNGETMRMLMLLRDHYLQT